MRTGDAMRHYRWTAIYLIVVVTIIMLLEVLDLLGGPH